MKTQLVEFKCNYCDEKVLVNVEQNAKPSSHWRLLSDNPLHGWVQIIREQADPQVPPEIEHYCKTSCAINGLKQFNSTIIVVPGEDK